MYNCKNSFSLSRGHKKHCLKTMFWSKDCRLLPLPNSDISEEWRSFLGTACSISRHLGAGNRDKITVNQNQLWYSYFLLKDGTMFNGKPLYRKNGNKDLYLAYSNISDYAAPWTMWGNKWLQQNMPYIGNIKIGPKNLQCPENNSVKILNYS